MDNSIKYKMVEKIINSEDELLLNEIKTLLGLGNIDFRSDLNESTKALINRGLEDSAKGRTRPHHLVMKEIKDRLSKME